MNPAGGNVAQTSANAYNQATGTAAAGSQYNPAMNAEQYMNPFRQQVVDRSLGTLDRANEMAINNVGGNATMQGAFGGARHGIAEAETNRAFADSAADMTAGLNAQGYDQAQRAAQGDANFRLQSTGLLGNLSQQGFNMGRTINQDMMQQGGMQQALQQQLIDRTRQQYQGFTGAPQQALQAHAGALGAAPNQSTTTTEERPGLFDYLSAGASFAGSAGGSAMLGL